MYIVYNVYIAHIVYNVYIVYNAYIVYIAYNVYIVYDVYNHCGSVLSGSVYRGSVSRFGGSKQMKGVLLQKDSEMFGAGPVRIEPVNLLAGSRT